MVEITGYKFDKIQQELTYYYVDLDKINNWIERQRTDYALNEREMVYDLKNSKHVYYLRNALKHLAKASCVELSTWGQAFALPVGHVIELNRYKRL